MRLIKLKGYAKYKKTKEKLLELADKYSNDYGDFHTQNTVSLKGEIIERELKELIDPNKEKKLLERWRRCCLKKY